MPCFWRVQIGGRGLSVQRDLDQIFLRLAQQIARGYGGELVAANNDGARFTLTLPLADGEA